MRRTAVALLASLALHATLLVVGLRLPGHLAFPPGAYLVPISLEDVRDLPLGPRPRTHGARVRGGEAVPTRTVKRPDPGKAVAAAPEAPYHPAVPAAAAAPQEGETPRRRGDLRAYGPVGSRLVAILRLDRLREAPDSAGYVAAVDDLLRLLPDRQQLLDGTNLDLYRDFDTLLVATPNPLDSTVTFVAARHRLDADALREALDRGAAAGGRTIEWRQERGRYVGVRKAQGRGSGTPERDGRLFLLPAPGLVVIAAPAYAKLLLDATGETGGPVAPSDPAVPARTGREWSEIVARLDEEDEATPEDAAFVLTATNLVARGGAAPVASGGLPIPGEISILIGTIPAPFLEIRAEFDDEKDARSCEALWPRWRQDLLANPLVLLAGAGSLVSAARLERDARTVVLRTSTTNQEMLRLLRLVAGFASSGKAGRAPGGHGTPAP